VAKIRKAARDGKQEPQNYQWVETNPSNISIFITDIRIFPTDIHFIAA
jgi:hypothetical protein